jgi:hypothetical protein
MEFLPGLERKKVWPETKLAQVLVWQTSWELVWPRALVQKTWQGSAVWEPARATERC